LPANVEKIGVFVDAALDEIVSTVQLCGLTGVQLHFDADSELPGRLRERLGSEARILRVIHFNAEATPQQQVQIVAHARNPYIDAVLVDSLTATAVGGTGMVFDWAAARKALFQYSETRKHLIAAGGLNPANVATAIAALRPWGVDVASGVEASPGHKDPTRVREFVTRAKAGNT
jgi:phosphoribosylanthranilate isomerase